MFYARRIFETALCHGIAGPCRRRQNHPLGSIALYFRCPAHSGSGGSRRCLFGYPRIGAPAGHHDFLQAGPFCHSQQRIHFSGYPRSRGFFRRNRACAADFGLCCTGHQRHRWYSGPHPDPLAAVGEVPGAHLPVYQQDGSSRCGSGKITGRAAKAAQPRLPGSGLCQFFGKRSTVR